MIRHARWFARTLAIIAVVALLAGCATGPTAQQEPRLDRIETIVVIYLENHSFDNLYGLFPAANGIVRATAAQTTQVDHDGTPLPSLPPVWGADGKPDPRFPQRLPNRPFRIDADPVNMAPDKIVPSPIHAFYHNQEQIDGGKNNRFAAVSNVGGWVMGYYDGSKFELWRWAREYTLADNFFMGAAARFSTTSGWSAPVRRSSRMRPLRCALSPTSEAGSSGARPRPRRPSTGP